MQQSCLYYFDIRLWSSFLYFLQWSPNTMCPPVWDSFLKLCCFFVKDISALKQENEHLRQEVDKLKAELEYWEVRNGCKFRVSYTCFAFFLLKLFYHWIEIGHAGFFSFSVKQVILPGKAQGTSFIEQEKVEALVAEQAEVRPEKAKEEKPMEKKQKKEKAEKKGKEKPKAVEGAKRK